MLSSFCAGPSKIAGWGHETVRDSPTPAASYARIGGPPYAGYILRSIFGLEWPTTVAHSGAATIEDQTVENELRKRRERMLSTRGYIYRALPMRTHRAGRAEVRSVRDLELANGGTAKRKRDYEIKSADCVHCALATFYMEMTVAWVEYQGYG